MPPPSSALVRRGIPAALGRSRSGQGGHVWIFFAEPVPASVARRLGAHLVTETMERNPDIGFSSYDRFFPSQDNMPAGGFGNLIALPLQHGPRLAGNSLFLDDTNLEPHTDQRAFLSTVRRMTLAEVTAIAEKAGRPGQVTGPLLRCLSLSPLAVTRIDAAAIAAVTPTKAGGVEMVAKSARKPAAMAMPCSATPSGARLVFSMAMKAEPDTIAASRPKRWPRQPSG
jgi:hypothetical protein